VDRLHDPAQRAGSPAWLQPSEALRRFEPPEALRLQAAEEANSRVRYGYRVGGLSFLIPVGTGSEVVPPMNTAMIPNSPKWLLGVINLRSSLVPVFDLANALGTDEDRAADGGNASGRKRVILVLDKGERAVGVLIDGFPRPLTGLRAVTQLPQLPEVLRSHVATAYADDEAIWLEFAHEGFLLDFGTRAECATA